MTERLLRWAVAALALIGAGIAGYLTYTHFKGSPPVCLTSGCEVVQNSRWSKLFGIPVALLGLLTYLSIIASTLIRHPLAKQAGAMLALVALGFNAYLLYIQEHEIGRYCTWCISNEIVSLILAPVAVAWLLSSGDSNQRAAS
ncbi:MAG TPA: vitamin K epoxide reductase family protein [Gaiellaceae bacterium]